MRRRTGLRAKRSNLIALGREGIALAFCLLAVAPFAVAGKVSPPGETAAPTVVKYKSGKEVNFEELLIQGQLKRPEVSVVTGDATLGSDGLVRLRENFLDQMSVASGEEVP